MQDTSLSTTSTPLELGPRHVSNWRRFWQEFRRNKAALVGLFIIAVMILIAIFADVLAPYDPIDPHYTKVLVSPSEEFPLGTDEMGRDLLSRLIYGARISLVIGLVAQSVAITLGVTLGAVSGWYGGLIDDVIMRMADIVFAIPGLMFLIVWVTILEPGPISIFLGLGLIGWAGHARMMRSQVLTIKEREYITAARAIGVRTSRILVQHVMPNALAPMIVLATLGVAGAILSESTLSFLGLGIQMPTPSWGTMVEMSRNYLPTGKWWYAIFPGVTIMITVLGFNFLGDGLRDALDPTQYN